MLLILCRFDNLRGIYNIQWLDDNMSTYLLLDLLYVTVFQSK